MKTIRQDGIWEQAEVGVGDRTYRITGAPSLALDSHPMVEVLVSEHRRHSHWRRLRHRSPAYLAAVAEYRRQIL